MNADDKTHAEHQASHPDKSFYNLLEFAPDIILLIDKEGIVKYVNQRIRDYGDYTPEEIIGKPVTDFIPAQDASEAKEAVKRVYDKNQKAPFFSSRLLLKDGKKVPILTKGTLIQFEGEWVNMTSIRDASDVITMEQLLKVSEDKYHSIFESNVDAITLSEIGSGRYVEVNDTFLKLTGYTRDEVVGHNSFELGLWVYKEQGDEMVRSLVETGKIRNKEYVFRTRNGRLIRGLVSAKLVYLGGVKFILAQVRDITSYRQTEEDLRKSQQLFETLMDISPVGIIRSDAQGITTYVNPKWCEITGYAFQEVLGVSWSKILHPDNNASLVDDLKRKVEASTASHVKFRILRADGSIRWVLGNASPEMDGEKLIGYVGTMTDITEQVLIEQALRESENRYRTLADTSSDMIVTFDQKGTLTYLSPAVKTMTGYTSDEVIGKNFLNFIAPEYVEMTLGNFKRGISGDEIPLYEVELKAKSGKRIPVELHVSSLLDAEGNAIGRLAVVRDITERKKAEKSLRESEERLATFSKITTEGILIHKEGVTLDANHTFLKMSGYTLEELKNKNVISLLVKPDYQEMTLRKAMQPASHPYDIVMVRKDGKELPVEISGIDFMDKNGKKARAVVVRDITQRRKMEESLRESERKYKEQSKLFRLMADNMPDMLWAKDMEGRYIFVNKSYCEDFLLLDHPDEAMGKTDMFLAQRQREMHPDDKEWFTFGEVCLDTDEVVLKSKKAQRFDEYGNVKGKFLFLDVYKAPIFDENNQIIGTVGHGRDVTGEKEAEKALLLRDKALNAAANAVVISRADGTIEWVNRAFTELSGYGIGESVGKKLREWVGTEHQNDTFYETLQTKVNAGEVWKGEFINQHKKGSRYEVEAVITPVLGEEGEVDYLIGIMTDIGERKKAERDLRAAKEAAEESSRLKTAFLANMNHEIRTPMNAIMGFSALMNEGSDKEKEEYAQIIHNSAGQLMKLIDDVIYLSRLQSERLPLQEKVFSPVRVVKEVGALFNLPEIRKNLQIIQQFPDKGANQHWVADVDKIKQVLTNLVSNAVKYTHKGYVKLGATLEDQSIVFFVEDTGMGIPKDEQSHIFEAFYRGREAETSAIRGTGLGLNIAKELVELMGGEIGLTSTEKVGTRFYFRIPVRKARPQRSKKPAHQIDPKNWNELSILIAEDDHTNFLYLEVLLKKKVGRIDWVQNGRDAVDKVIENHYDLVLMDIKMPIMNGDEATRRIKETNPDLPVIATTAYATPEEKNSALKAGCDAYLSKPIKKEDLYAMMNRFVPDN